MLQLAGKKTVRGQYDPAPMALYFGADCCAEEAITAASHLAANFQTPPPVELWFGGRHVTTVEPGGSPAEDARQLAALLR